MATTAAALDLIDEDPSLLQEGLNTALNVDGQGKGKKTKKDAASNLAATLKKGVAGINAAKGKLGGGKATGGKTVKGAKKTAVVEDSESNNAANAEVLQQTAEDEEAKNVDGKVVGEKDQFAEEDDVDWESDLDVDVIINAKHERDPYIVACESIGAVPVSFVLQRLGNSEIVMKYHGLGDRGARALGKVLEKNKTVARLDLTGNSLETGGKYFAASLGRNSAITHLNLTDNNLKYAAAEIAEMISDNSTITSLILSKNGFGDKEAELIANGLKQNQFLKVIDLSHNNIGDVGGIALGQGLAVNDGLKELDVSWNEMRSKGLAGFLNGIKDNATIINLNISHNGIGEAGNLMLPFLSKTNVIRLSIGYTRLSDISFAVILKGLEGNRSVQELDISGNSLTTPSLQALFKVVPTLKITALTLKDIRFSKEVVTFIDSLKKDLNVTV